MKRLIKPLVTLTALASLGWAGYGPGLKYWKNRSRVTYRDAQVTRGNIIATVNSTGTVKPVRSVQVGSFVSGPIKYLFVDFNDEVKAGQVLAVIDPQIYNAAEDRDRAMLATREAEVNQVQAKLQQAINDEKRSKDLRAERKDFISDAEMDQFKFSRMSLEAQLTVAKTMVKQAQASLDRSVADVGYTKILSPVDGVIIDRKIDPGQTVAAQFQTPELFVVAPDMRKEMRVFASVDEADIGLIRKAQKTNQPVHFTVDAYPDDLFEGKIFEVRMSSTTTQNVVTYPVIVSAPNPELKLMPGMTASISFQVKVSRDVLRIPNAALRFYPDRDQVRPEDRELLEGFAREDNDDAGVSGLQRSATDKAEARRKRNRRHVWVVEGDFLKAVEVVTGISDSKYTELVAGDLTESQRLVTGVKPRE